MPQLQTPNHHPTLISNPRRLLILTPTSHSLTTIPPFLHSLTGSPVRPPTTDTHPDSPPTFAGYTTHAPLPLENKYYKTEIPIWVDEIPLPATPPNPTNSEPLTPSTWKTEFAGPEAKVVRDAVGGVVICLRNPEPDATSTAVDAEESEEWRGVKAFLEAVGFVKGVMDDERGVGEVVGLVVLVGRDRDGGLEGEEEFSVPWWEDQLVDLGLVGVEVVNWDPRRVDEEVRDRFGEYQGMRRVREILETHDWTSVLGDGDGDVGEDGEDELERHLLGDGFDLEVRELEREMVGLQFAMENGDDDLTGVDGDDEMRVESMESLMLRMKAIKDMSDELPENERKRFAAKAVRDIMKEL
ncbi:alpha and gamma adaptin binding protein p34-domain-containing protein [Aspergillus coremiiformis]|uniref:Alpha and gamma adaptin binding protein p34-domain-containing protein n=1 Tax=Aspergillus coremiiformis TaxID=138285 RepID=A0A5N6YZG4_9EURO|nr:alpha and gamma adaptin binding protein p34-domain-containing protein [Aspergillus coremiiformis]